MLQEFQEFLDNFLKCLGEVVEVFSGFFSDVVFENKEERVCDRKILEEVIQDILQ